MRIGYVVSMFPCWSETFILNELLDHRCSGENLTIFSLKECSEGMIHDEAKTFLEQTIYPSGFFKLLLMHFRLVLSSPIKYFVIFYKLFFLDVTKFSVKIKSLAIFAIAPTYVFSARKKNIDHLHAHFATYPSVLAWIIGKFNNIPFTFTAHAHDIYVNNDLLPLLGSESSKIITISEFNKKFILNVLGGIYVDKVNVIRCGINLDLFKYDSKNNINCYNDEVLQILSIGRLSGIKGFQYLIEALSIVRGFGIDFECNIIGDGPLRDELILLVEALGLSKFIHFLGSKKSYQIPDYLKKADVFILACATDRVEGHDGIPVVFMEAMAYGVPVIGTQLSGIPELIMHKETGFCALPEDPNSLAETIEYFYNNGQKVEEIRFAARNLIEEKYDIHKNSKTLRRLIEEILY